ncbi:MAG: TRAP transporter permease, partial [Candidatus Thiodiazotropha taylori]|nr:TRAP transporter permease [Candidatus Thiodiazotropha taylori]
MFSKLNKLEQWAFDAMAIGLVLFYSYSAVLEPAATQYHRGVYVIITYILVFLLYRSDWGGIFGRIWDYLLMVVAIVTLGYWILNFEAINYRAGAETELDTWIAVAGVLVGIEVARRVVGTVFVV